MTVLLTWVVTFVIACITVSFHVHGLRCVAPIFEKQSIWKIFKGTSIILLLHIIEVIAFGILFWLGVNIADAGTIEGASSLKDYMYFSVASYTSLGLGDLYPTGSLRILSGIEALIGLTMIAWTAAFSYKYIAE